MEKKLTEEELFDLPKPDEAQSDLTIKSAAIEYDSKIYNSKAKSKEEQTKNRVEAATRMYIFYQNGQADVFDFGNDSYEEKWNQISSLSQFIDKNLEDSKQYKSYMTGNKTFERSYDKALAISDKEEAEDKKNRHRKIWMTVAAIAIAGAVGSNVVAKTLKKDSEESINKNNAVLNHSVSKILENVHTDKILANISLENIKKEYSNLISRNGRYNVDLSELDNMTEYCELTSESEQKTHALEAFNILLTFNDTIKMQDEFIQVGGLTIEQLIAIDAYSNTNVYTKEDYVKLFGLYDFSNIITEFQSGVNSAAAYLANKEVDGKVLANIFKDEKVKAAYLKMLEYRDKILGSDKKDQKKYIKELEQYIASTSDKLSENYMDYSDHPGMSFVSSTIVNALNYNYISLSKEIVSKHLIMGKDGVPSLINTICENADTKIEEVQNFIKELNDLIPDPKAVEIATEEYNKAEKVNAEKTNRQPAFRNAETIIADRRFEALVKYPDIVSLVLNNLCDQTQINDLINHDLMEANKYVTLEDQDKIMSNAVALLRNIQKRNQPLPNKGDKVTVTVKKQEVIPEAPAQSQVPVVSEQTLVEKQPELAEQAREEFNEAYEAATGEELFPYETPEQQQESDQKMQEQDTQKITNYYYEVLRWYEENGYNDEFSDAVREAQAVLDPSAFEAAKNTGIGRYEDANGPEYEGGDEDYDSEFDDVDTNATGENNQEITDSTVVIAPDEKTPDPTPTPAPVETKEPVVEQPVESQKPVETEEPSPEPTKEPEKVVISPFDDDETIEYPTPSNTPEVPVEEGSHISSDFADIDISDITTEARNTKDFSQLSDEQKFMYALQILSDEELSALFAPTNASSIENTNTHRI